MRFAFFGTDSFSVAILEKLISDFYRPVVVVTQPDKPVGRRQTMTPPPIKDVCEHHLIPCLQPQKVKEIVDDLKGYDLDLIIVASFGQIIPQTILDMPRLGAINVHTSLLPKYRGASPIQSAILRGEDVTGITIMKMDAELDHGDILFQKNVKIESQETYRTLHSKLAHVGAEVLTKVLPFIEKGKIKAAPQNHSLATFTERVKKEDAKIDWAQPAEKVDRTIRAYYDWPIAWTTLPDGKRLKILEATVLDRAVSAPGTLHISKETSVIDAQNGALKLNLVQVEGGKRMLSGSEFAAGYNKFNGKKAS